MAYTAMPLVTIIECNKDYVDVSSIEIPKILIQFLSILMLSFQLFYLK